MKRALYKWLGVTLALVVFACVALSVSLLLRPVAQAESEYTLVLYDGDMKCKLGDKENAYCYAFSDNQYIFTYYEGINLRPQAILVNGAEVAVVWGKYDIMDCVKRDADGKVTAYTFTGRINGNENKTFYVRIEPRTVSVTWDTDSLTCMYGEDIAPVVTTSPVDVSDTLRFVVDDGTGNPMKDTNGNPIDFDTDYVRKIGRGSYTIRPMLPQNSNYQLSAVGLSAEYVVKAYSGQISVERDSATIFYNGTSPSVLELLGATAAEGYPVLAKYSALGSDSWTTYNYLPDSAGSYRVFLTFEGDERNYEYFRSPASGFYSIVISPSSVTLAPMSGELSIAYSRDNTALDFAMTIYGLMGNAYNVTDAEGNAINCGANDFTYTYQLTADGPWSATPPDTVGSFRVRIHFNGNANYKENDAEADLLLPFTVTKGEVTIRWLQGYPRVLEYGQFFNMDDYYAVDSNEFNDWLDAGNQADYSLSYEVATATGTFEPYVVGASAPLPGKYHIKVNLVDCDLYCGASEWATVDINKVALHAEDISFDGLQYVYGQDADIEPVLRDGLQLMGGVWSTRFGQGEQQDLPLSAVGVYDVYLTLENDAMYSCDLVFNAALQITPKPVDMWVWDYNCTYGDTAFTEGVTHGLENEGVVWWRIGSVLESDEKDFLRNLSVEVQAPSGAWVSQVGTAFGVNNEGYPLRIVSNNPNYTVTYKSEARLYVRQRALHVGVSGSLNLYEGAQPRLGIDIGAAASDADAVVLEQCFSLFFTGEDGTVYDEAPTDVGTYSVQLKQADAPILRNYNVQFATVKLIIRSLVLPTTQSDFGVSGRFGNNDTLSVEKVANSRYNSAASNVLKGYHVIAAYEISEPVETVVGQITFSFTVPADARSPKVLYLEGNEWVEVAVERQGNVLTFSQHAMSTKYLICARRAINWLLIGLIAGGVVLVAVGVVVALMVPRLRRQKKLAAEASQQVAAPTAKATAAPDEDEELDSFIESFDESTVQRELTPAERIALREKEEKYQQYKARLARMRTSNRTMQDTLRALGMSDDSDDDTIIARMMEADEERARQLEEDLRREEEETRLRQEEETRTVILERGDEVLEQRTFAPTVSDSDDDDDDIDI